MATPTKSAESTEKKRSPNPRTPIFRVSFEKIWRPEVSKGKDKDGRALTKTTYSLTALIPKGEDVSQLWEVARISLVKEFPNAEREKNGEWFKGGYTRPIRDGDTDETLKNREECNGHWVVAMRCNTAKYDDDGSDAYGRKPEIRLNDPHKTPITEKNKQLFYSGCYAICTFNAYSYNVDGGKKKGSSMGLINILKMRDGERLTQNYSADDDFAEVESSEDWDTDNSSCLNEGDDDEQ